jgi:outer membrane lipoprotein-sorting protein
MAIFRNVLFLMLLFTGMLSAQTLTPLADPSEFLKKIKQVSSATNTLKADFTEEKHASYLKEPQKSSGTFYYKKDNKLRWEKTKPSTYILLMDGDKVRLKENSQEKNVSAMNSMIGRIRDLMISLVRGDFSNNKAFTPVYFQTQNTYVVKLVPKNKKLVKIFDHIQLTISKETMRLKEIVFMEKTGDKSIMKFYNDSVNLGLDDKLFTNF